MRKRRLRKAIEACARGMDVCQRMVDNELANKSAYQTRQMLLIKELADMGESSYVSTLLSRGENPWWVAKQMGHVDVEMIFRRYGKWIPNKDGGQYQTVNDWSAANSSRRG
jgi:integrase